MDASKLAPHLVQRAAGDTGFRRATSFQLTDAFNGNVAGLAEEMAYIAASLYQTWDLPPQAAAAFLADPAYSFRARARAIRALEPYWGTSLFRQSAAAALCSLAARSDGITVSMMLPDTAAAPLEPDEFQFLSDVMYALGRGRAAGGAPIDTVLGLLPPHSGFLRSLKAQYGSN